MRCLNKMPPSKIILLLVTLVRRKSPLWNNISPSNIKYCIENKKTLIGGQIQNLKKILLNTDFSRIACQPVPACLTNHSRKPRGQTKQCTAIPFYTTITNPPMGCAFWILTSLCPLCLVFPFIFYQADCLLVVAVNPY